MSTTRSAANCRWAESTLYMAGPLWLDAWDFPWTCMRDRTPRLLETTDECATCPRWEGGRRDSRPFPRTEPPAPAA
jgi:hypothetical protein